MVDGVEIGDAVNSRAVIRIGTTRNALGDVVVADPWKHINDFHLGRTHSELLHTCRRYGNLDAV